MPEIRLTLRIPGWMCGGSLPTGAGIAAGFVALDLLLFVPLYLLVSQEHDFWPFFPREHPRGQYDWGWAGLGRSSYEYVMQLFVRRGNMDMFRVSADWVFIVSSLVLASRFAGGRRATAVSLAWFGYVALLAFMAYTGFVHALFDRPGTVLDDVLMLESAWIFVRDTWDSRTSSAPPHSWPWPPVSDCWWRGTSGPPGAGGPDSTGDPRPPGG